VLEAKFIIINKKKLLLPPHTILLIKNVFFFFDLEILFLNLYFFYASTFNLLEIEFHDLLRVIL